MELSGGNLQVQTYVSLVGSQSTDISHFMALQFIALCRYCIFLLIKDLCKPALSESISSIFPKAFTHFVFVTFL